MEHDDDVPPEEDLRALGEAVLLLRKRQRHNRRIAYLEQQPQEDLRLEIEEKIRVSLFAHKAPLQFVDGIQRYRHKDILFATNNFSHENLITEGASGKVYKGQLLRDGIVMNFTVRRLYCTYGQGDEMQTEISTLKSLKHKNIISIFGHYDEDNENIIIYEQAFHGTLDQHLSNPTLTWSQRLKICLGVARALSYIHYDVIHCDINSSKIFLDKDWEPKIYGFELSTKYPQSWRHRLLYSRYFGTYNMTPKYDVNSFGVLLFEVLCGRKLMTTDYGNLEELIDPNIRNQMEKESLEKFKGLAYKCLNLQLVEHLTMYQVVKDLEEVLELQWENTNLEPSVDEGTPSNSLKVITFFTFF
ncbi:putative protein kinase RLK-Pelle-CrRLK1L-1 family [Helianthus annuus]|nr:putative protein kinase RLK-Pelle-CrRLK1L-1 family [Helianthus annuus]